MTYFVIHSTSDGAIIELLDEGEVLKRLNSDYWGSKAVFINDTPRTPLDSIIYQTAYWGENSVLIIKGEIVTPKPEGYKLT